MNLIDIKGWHTLFLDFFTKEISTFLSHDNMRVWGVLRVKLLYSR